MSQIPSVHPSVPLREQSYTELSLQYPHLPAERRLGNANSLGDARKRTEFGDLDEETKPHEVGHSRSPYQYSQCL